MTTPYTLAEALRIAENVVPGLNATVFDSGVDASGASGAASAADAPLSYRHPGAADQQQAAIAALLAHWSGAYPEAGRAYWSLRCWGILIWKPIYLSVIAVHRAQCIPSLAGLEQRIVDGWTQEVHYPAHRPAQGSATELITLAAAEIGGYCEPVFDALSHLIRINARSARGMQADCVLAAVLAAETAASAPRIDGDIEALGARWLAALALDRCSGFFGYRARDGTHRVAIDRQTCCYHYRRRDGELCNTCPRLTQCERIARLDGTPLPLPLPADA